MTIELKGIRNNELARTSLRCSNLNPKEQGQKNNGERWEKDLR